MKFRIEIRATERIRVAWNGPRQFCPICFRQEDFHAGDAPARTMPDDEIEFASRPRLESKVKQTEKNYDKKEKNK